MNFYIVPPILYQEQQKMKKKKHENRKGKSQLDSSSERGQTRSSKSINSSRSIHSISEVDQAGEFGEKSSLTRHNGNLGSSSSKSIDIASNVSRLNLSLLPEGGIPTSSSAMNIDLKPSSKQGSILGLLHSNNSVLTGHSARRDASYRKMSFSQVPTASTAVEPPSISTIPGENFKGPINSRRSINFKGTAHSKSLVPKFEIPKFEFITDLSILNDPVTARRYFYNQLILETRFLAYLESLSEYQLSDPINFAGVRAESLIKLIKRHGQNHLERSAENKLKHVEDIRYYEGLLFYELMQCRTFVGQLLLAESTNNSEKEPLLFNETLLQLNFANYVWYVLCLPNISLNDQTSLDEVVSKHYHFKSIFFEARNALYDLNMENYSEDASSSAAGTNLFMQSVAKVTSEFVILETYFIHILCKFGGNFPIDSRVTKHLFSLYDLNVKLKNPESLKVLHYNTLLSDRFSWNLAIKVPFVRVFEMSINNEFKDSINDLQAYLKQSHTGKINFHDKDKSLFDQYFKMLNIRDYEHYRSMTGHDFVDLQKSASQHMHMSSMLDDNTNKHFQKPPNLEYYTDSMFTIASNTFHVINCRDAYFQFTTSNYRVILREFYRLLKSGGILELPLFIPGDFLFDTMMRQRRAAIGADLLAPKQIDNFVFSICEELNSLFGMKNVKFSEVLLSPQNSISAFWVKYISLLSHDAYGDLNTFCANHNLGDDSRIQKSEEKHYYCYIRAEKN